MHKGVQALAASAYDGVTATLIDSVPFSTLSCQAVVDSTNVFVSYAIATFSSRDAGSTTGALGAWTVSNAAQFVHLDSVLLKGAPWTLNPVNHLLAVQTDSGFQLFDKSNPARLSSLGSFGGNWTVSLDFADADGDAGSGLWIPLGDYGVDAIGLSAH